APGLGPERPGHHDGRTPPAAQAAARSANRTADRPGNRWKGGSRAVTGGKATGKRDPFGSRFPLARRSDQLAVASGRGGFNQPLAFTVYGLPALNPDST